ncbi:MAG: class I tRNA ligase family protein [Candidatus Paceibacterota bacterium]|jgi:isoleucyl-tRNA synthetase
MLKDDKLFSLPDIEERILTFWKKQDVFKQTLEKNKKKSTRGKKKKFIFYEGPPTANGRPGIHHVLARSFKDVVPRYKTMQGYEVPRKGGWDTHGLPVEIEVEKALGLKSKKEVEQYGVAAFNAKCKESVWKYKDEWERLTERMGFWLDMEHPYITYENKYMESLWWIFSEIFKKGLLYQGHKVVPWCTRCGTTLSSHELALGYKEVEDTSVYIKFKVKKGEKIGASFIADNATYILSWTTTPWTLPGNVALAVGEKIEYARVTVGETKKKETYILAESRLSILEGAHKTEEIIQGKELVGVSYEPLFPIAAFVTGTAKNTSYKVYPADFVTTSDGTGVVHTAVMYGEDDYNLGKKVGLPELHTVNEQGKFVEGVPELAGMYVKAKEVEEKIFAALAAKKNLLRTEPYTHEYPFCWRCSSPLLYYARHSWFIKMSLLRDVLTKENKSIHWTPENLKEGRFGEWIREVKDWAISRERYWGTPLPIWECGECKTTTTIGSVEELEKAQKASGNRYIFVRHGGAESNLKNILSSWPETTKSHLTLKGTIQVGKAARKLLNEKIDFIFSSDITRARETAHIISQKLNVPVIYDERLREINVGDMNGLPIKNYTDFFTTPMEKFTKAPFHGETLTELRARMLDFITSIEAKYGKKTILIVGHDDPLWMLESTMQGWLPQESLKVKEERGGVSIKNAEMREVPFRMIPRDTTGAFDMHKPYIDSVTFKCTKCEGVMKRIPEVADVWFDSGAMPFAQAHYPFEHGKGSKNELDFPADYISEGIDQTRGWFYTLLAISVLLGRTAPYKNVISLGLVLDKNGQKMSKSKGNIVSPWDMIQKYGVDVIRWYFYTVNGPGEAKKFDEAELGKVSRQFFALAYNSFVFFNMYGDPRAVGKSISGTPHILDKWILARLNETILTATEQFEAYEIGNAARAIEAFTDDMSRWYIRRSRRRLQKPESKKELETVSRVYGHVLLEFSKLLAPFSPFFAEALYKSLITKEKASVHLEDWPLADKKLIDIDLIVAMKEVRILANLGLAKRAEKAIKVRQPLAALKVKSQILKGKDELLEILKDEVNVKEIIFDKTLVDDAELTTEVTQALREEGWLREIVRFVQGLRQDASCSPKNTITVHMEVPQEFSDVIRKNEAWIRKEVNATKVECKRADRFSAELETKLDGQNIWLCIRKK